MPFTNTNDHYGWTAQLLHWTMALLMMGLFGLGWWMVDLSFYHAWYHHSQELHQALGMLALTLATARIGWAMYQRPPPLQANIRPWQRLAANLTHHTLYLMTLAIPISGYLITTASGQGIDVFGWFEIPSLFPPSKGREEITGSIHKYLSYGTGILVLAHVGAALKHQFIDRDGTLRRMTGPDNASHGATIALSSPRAGEPVETS